MTTEQTPEDLQPSSGQTSSNAYIYKLKQGDKYISVAVIAPNSTTARAGLGQQFPNHTVAFNGVCEHILQVNG